MAGALDGREQQAAAVPVHSLDDERAAIADVVTAAIARMARIIDDLMADLARIDGELAEEAHTAARYGVKIGTDGRPPPGPGGGRPVSAAEASEQHWALSYRAAWERAAVEARDARQRAVSRLENLCATIELPRPRGRAVTVEGNSQVVRAK